MKTTTFITGASSGIGVKTAELALQRGNNVIGIDKNQPKFTVNDIDKSWVFFQGNVTDRAFVRSSINEGFQKFGSINQFFNNAGYLGKRMEIADFCENDWQNLLSVNLTGALVCMAEELRHLLQWEGGSIVNNASVSGISGSFDYPLYSAAKHGVVGLTKSLAKRYASQNIRCNAICPSTVLSPMTDKEAGEYSLSLKKEAIKHPLKRFATTEEIASTALWLLSSEASYINGQCLAVDGGLSI